jgi:hypothetical protein
MTVEQVFTIGVIAALATAAIYLGPLNWMGAFYLVRCAACHHLTFSSSYRSQESCPLQAPDRPIALLSGRRPAVTDSHRSPPFGWRVDRQDVVLFCCIEIGWLRGRSVRRLRRQPWMQSTGAPEPMRPLILSLKNLCRYR